MSPETYQSIVWPLCLLAEASCLWHSRRQKKRLFCVFLGVDLSISVVVWVAAQIVIMAGYGKSLWWRDIYGWIFLLSQWSVLVALAGAAIESLPRRWRSNTGLAVTVFSGVVAAAVMEPECCWPMKAVLSLMAARVTVEAMLLFVNLQVGRRSLESYWWTAYLCAHAIGALALLKSDALYVANCWALSWSTVLYLVRPLTILTATPSSTQKNS